MSSQLNVDTIVDKAGSGGTNVKIGNTSTYVSDGGSVTQNTVQGLAKTWLRMNGDNTPAINDSLNITSITDQATGNYRVTIANDMANATYSATTGAGGATSNNTLMNCATPGDALGAGTIDLDLQYQHQTANDPEIVSFALHGDLA